MLDDHAGARHTTARRLKSRGFHVVECSNAKDFLRNWKPGTVDVVVADWQLSHDPKDQGDRVLEEVRKRDWDVPFVLVSGKLDDGSEKAEVLQRLLESGSARFVRRGNDGIRQACDDAEDLIERRDLMLLKVILSLRDAALTEAEIVTSSGKQSVSNLLESIVSKPKTSHDAERPIVSRRSRAPR